MATAAKIILDTRSITKSKGHPIKIYISNNGHKYLSLKEREYSFKEDWDGHGPLPSHPDYDRLRKKLIKRGAKLIREIDYCNQNNLDLSQSTDIIKNGIEDRDVKIAQLEAQIAALKGDSQTMLFEFWEKFTNERIAARKSIKIFEEVKGHLMDYTLGDDIPINSINYEFLKGFSVYKMENGCGLAGLSVYLRQLRTVYKSAQKRESLKIKSSNPFEGFIKSGTKKPPVEMAPEEMVKWKNFIPHQYTPKKAAKIMIRRRDLWLFQFYIGGHDLIDIASLKWKENIRNGRIRFKRYKNIHHPSGGPLIDNVLVQEALDIIDKYGTPKRERVFSFIPDPKDKVSYSYYRNNTLRALAKIAKNIGISDKMKTKSTRYVFKTWANQLQLHEASVKQIQGHAERGVSDRYGARLPNEQVDAVLQKVILKIAKK